MPELTYATVCALISPSLGHARVNFCYSARGDLAAPLGHSLFLLLSLLLFVIFASGACRARFLDLAAPLSNRTFSYYFLIDFLDFRPWRLLGQIPGFGRPLSNITFSYYFPYCFL